MVEPLSRWFRNRLLDSVEPVQEKPGCEVVTLVVTVKAYPAIGRTTGEAVCVAGIRIDQETPSWMRLFPVPFRDLPQVERFKKWQVIRLRVRRGNTDRRMESYKPDLSTIKLGMKITTQNATWADRWELVDPLIDQFSACELYENANQEKHAAASLGLITPRVITDLKVEQNSEALASSAVTHEQPALFGEPQSNLEPPPFNAIYHYKCQDFSCKGHKQTLVDWESGEFARKNISTMGVEEAMKQHRVRFLDEICSATNNIKFFVGNQHRYLHGFLVLGLFYPKQDSNQPFILDF